MIKMLHDIINILLYVILISQGYPIWIWSKFQFHVDNAWSHSLLGKQKTTNLESWKDTHHALWPGMSVPALLIPIGSREKAPEGQLKWFQELTVPTSLMISIYAFQVSNAKRNRHFRDLAAPPLVELISRSFQTGNLTLNIPTIGGNQAWNLTIPASGQVPLACLIHQQSAQAMFEEEWTWMTQDWLLFKDGFH